MKSLNLRVTALAILLLTLLSLSGAPFADAGLTSADTTAFCCFPADQGEALPQTPCATSDCPCLSCLNLHLPRFAEIFFLPTPAAKLVCHPLVSPLAAFTRPIEYPPEYS